MASLAARSTSACATFPAEKGGDTEGTKKENDESIVDPDAALLMSMDREVHKYERLTRLNSKLEEEIKGGSPRRSTSSSSGGRPAGVPCEFEPQQVALIRHTLGLHVHLELARLGCRQLLRRHNWLLE